MESVRQEYVAERVKDGVFGKRADGVIQCFLPMLAFRHTQDEVYKRVL